jgi:hypothetical protein
VKSCYTLGLQQAGTVTACEKPLHARLERERELLQTVITDMEGTDTSCEQLLHANLAAGRELLHPLKICYEQVVHEKEGSRSPDAAAEGNCYIQNGSWV